MTKFCKDCANCVPDAGRSLNVAKCAKSLKNNTLFYVTGQPTPDMDLCTTMRAVGGLCGHEGKLYQAKVVKV